MYFQTWTFALFFLLFWPVYVLVKGTRLRIPWLLAASYVFYGSMNPLYPVLLFYATTVDYLAVTGMAKTRAKTPWLLLSLVNSLGLLGFFKYSRLVVETVNALLGQCGLSHAIPVPGVILPVGLSFFLFQSLTYTIGHYRGEVQREPNFLRYAAFVAFFPTLLMGPIERARNLLAQLRQPPAVTWHDVADGLSLLVVGLFKKLLLADFLALYVDKVYAAPGQFGAPALLMATFAFAWQVYFDFSGYTDMARGVARAIGIRLMLNFNNPYLATGLGDFWRRWHISLSTWFRDYLYIPLGGNRGSVLDVLPPAPWSRRPSAERIRRAATYKNMFVTMVISGLWHGATWNFALWGAIHGLGRVLTRRLEESQFYRNRIPRFVKSLYVFLFVSFAWIFFRAESFGDAWRIVVKIADLPGMLFASIASISAHSWARPWQLVARASALVSADAGFPLVLLAMIAAVWLYEVVYESRLRGILQPAPVRVGLAVVLVVCIALFARSGVQPFIYSQF